MRTLDAGGKGTVIEPVPEKATVEALRAKEGRQIY